ncbi:glycosyltransferase family 4 protein [Arthrobacter castelli]|uniref:glycosyltransferase family 4 protein n=1 Tax=Arthrobacter castelli TaxID=271431 RepID=UPI00041904A1|nr:glycosyltransferase family 4 protein [Arthrobacter castelli]
MKPSNDSFTADRGVAGSRVAYVLKIYPRFSETFIVTEILAREAAGERLEIFSLRPTVDPRFHPELARVQAPVNYVAKPAKLSEGWEIIMAACAALPGFEQRFAQLLPELVDTDPADVHQGVELAVRFVRQGITHIHAHFGSIAARTARIASGLTGIPFSFTAHAKDIFHQDVDQATLISLMTEADHVITVSDYNLDYLRKLCPGCEATIHRVYNGLELERFRYEAPVPPHSPFRIAAVGRLVEKKGFDLLLDAAATLVRGGLALELRIAGGGPQYDQLEKQIHDLGLTESVSLPGPRTQQEVSDLLRWADVFVAPCVTGQDGNVDGLPTVLLEAMAVGVPCIASDVTGIPEVMADRYGRLTGVLIRSGVSADIVDAVSFCASESFDRQATTTAARELIERCFDSRSQASRLRSLASGNGMTPEAEPGKKAGLAGVAS